MSNCKSERALYKRSMAAIAAPPRIGPAVMIGAAAFELEEEPLPAEDEPPATADEAALAPLETLLPAAPLADEAPLDPELAAPPTAVKRVVDPMVEVVSALLPDEMVVTRALVVYALDEPPEPLAPAVPLPAPEVIPDPVADPVAVPVEMAVMAPVAVTPAEAQREVP